jgi:hypothetical protein
MARFQLYVDGRGRMLLATPASISAEMVQAIKAQFAAWKDAEPPELLVVPETEVCRIVDLELTISGEAG